MKVAFEVLKAPFKEIYLHGLVRDEKGQKMSKTKGLLNHTEQNINEETL